MALSYIAAERNASLTYRSQTDEMRHKAAASRKRQCLHSTFIDEDTEFGPPDKRRHVKNSKIGQKVEVKYDNDV